MDSLDTQRQFLRSDLWSEWDALETDQRKGLPTPPPEKPYPSDAALIDLVAPDDLAVGQMPLIEAIRRRRSHRQYAEAPLTLEELSFLLWATQGVREVRHSGENVTTFRSVPSAGSRHPFVGDPSGLREIEAEIDQLAAELWGLTQAELAEIQKSLAELG